MTKPADMDRDELLAEVDRMATLNNELSQILNRNADTLQGSVRQIQVETIEKVKAEIRDRGGILPEDLPQVTRVEVIGATGRLLAKRVSAPVVTHMQDEGRTLKLFVQAKS